MSVLLHVGIAVSAFRLESELVSQFLGQAVPEQLAAYEPAGQSRIAVLVERHLGYQPPQPRLRLGFLRLQVQPGPIRLRWLPVRIAVPEVVRRKAA